MRVKGQILQTSLQDFWCLGAHYIQRPKLGGK